METDRSRKRKGGRLKGIVGAEASSGVNGMPIVRSDSRDLKGLDSSSPLKGVSRVTGQPRKPNPALMQ